MCSLPREYHAHVYFDKETVQQAVRFCQQVSEKFEIHMGRVHQKNVGPHPSWSCLLIFPPQMLGQLIEYMTLHRRGLVVFIHPDTGNDLLDHTEHLIWLGESKPLKIDQFVK